MDENRVLNRKNIGVIGVIGIIFLTTLGTGSITHHLNALKIFIFIASVSIAFLIWLIFSGNKKIKFYPTSLLYILCNLLPCIALLWSDYNYDAGIYLTVSLATLLFIILITNGITEQKQLSTVLSGLIILIFLLTVLSLLQFSNTLFFYGREFTNRVFATLGNPNYLGGILVILLPPGAAYGLSIYGKVKKPIFIITWAMITGGIITLIMTQCRGAWLGFAAGALLFFLLLLFISKNHHKKGILLSCLCFILTGCLLLTILMFTNSDLKTRVMTSISQVISGDVNALLGTRFVAWDTALKMWLADIKSLLFGGGTGAYYANHFQNLHPEYLLLAAGSSFKHTHNEYLEILADGGILSLISWLLLVSYAVSISLITIRDKNAPRLNRLLGIGIISGISGMMIHSLLSLVMRTMVVYAGFYLLIALAQANYLIARQKPIEESETSGIQKRQSLSAGSQIKIKGRKHKAVLILIFLITTALLTIAGFRNMMAERAMKKGYEAPSRPESLQWFEKSLVWNSRNIYGLYETMWLQSENPEKSMETIEKMEAIIPGYRQTTWAKGVNQIITEDFEGAVETLNRFRTYNRMEASTYVFLIMANIRMNKPEEVVKNLQDLFINRNKYMMNLPERFYQLEKGELSFSEIENRIKVTSSSEGMNRMISRAYLRQVTELLMKYSGVPYDVLISRIYLTIGSLHDELEYGDESVTYYMEAIRKGAISPEERDFIYEKVWEYYLKADEEYSEYLEEDDEEQAEIIKLFLVKYIRGLLSIKDDSHVQKKLSLLIDS